MNDVLNYFDHDHATPEEVSTGKWTAPKRLKSSNSTDSGDESELAPMPKDIKVILAKGLLVLVFAVIVISMACGLVRDAVTLIH